MINKAWFARAMQAKAKGKTMEKTKTFILDLHVGHVGGEAQKNILSVLLWDQPLWASSIVW